MRKWLANTNLGCSTNTWPEEKCKRVKVVKTKGAVKWSRLKIKRPDGSMQCLVLAQILDQAKKMAIKGLIGPIGEL